VPSNPTSRTLAVLDHLARSHEPTGLSELTRQTGLAKATCLAVLQACAAAGWVVQDEATRKYTIGPALLAASAATQRRYGDWSRAAPVITELADEIGGLCTVLVPAQDQLITVAVSDRSDPLSRFVPVGHRLAFVPPFGAASVVWADRAAFDAWMARAEPPVSVADERELRRALRISSRRGWVATSFATATRRARTRLAEMQRAMTAAEYLERSRQLAPHVLGCGFVVGSVGDRSRCRVASVSAPLHRSQPGPHAVLYVDAHGDELTGRELDELGRRTVAAAEALTERCPPPDPEAR
jgi:DNA-binding IclR family transcriptional regulator